MGPSTFASVNDDNVAPNTWLRVDSQTKGRSRANSTGGQNTKNVAFGIGNWEEEQAETAPLGPPSYCAVGCAFEGRPKRLRLARWSLDGDAAVPTITTESN